MSEADSTFNDGRHHDGLRGLDQRPVGNVFKPGRFGRMFPALSPLELPDADVVVLGEAMTELAPGDPDCNNPGIPAGYTYLGQIIDHDMTFDTTARSEQPRHPQAIFNFRTPQLELDSLYGAGPRGAPHLYERVDRARFGIGVTSDAPGGGNPAVPVSQPHDLPRMAGTASQSAQRRESRGRADAPYL